MSQLVTTVAAMTLTALTTTASIFYVGSAFIHSMDALAGTFG